MNKLKDKLIIILLFVILAIQLFIVIITLERMEERQIMTTEKIIGIDEKCWSE